MLIKPPALLATLNKKRHALYILTGQDPYLLNEAAVDIKRVCQQQHACDSKTLQIHAAEDWRLLIEEANSYSLFADSILLDVRYDKKTLDSAGKKALQTYIEQINPRCIVIFRASNVPHKQFSGFVNHESVGPNPLDQRPINVPKHSL